MQIVPRSEKNVPYALNEENRKNKISVLPKYKKATNKRIYIFVQTSFHLLFSLFGLFSFFSFYTQKNKYRTVLQYTVPTDKQ